MILQLFQTDASYVYLALRLVAGIIIFPYGMQKLLGWFDDFGGGVGIKATLARMKQRHIPSLLAWLVIFGQSLGSIALLVGFAGRIAAAGNFLIFLGAVFVHLPDGWVMNWYRHKKDEGIEYFVMLLSILMIIIIKGSGAFSIDLWLWQNR
jgi:putative oxidoreductase